MLGQLGDRVSLGPNIRKLITGYSVGEAWVVPVAADALDAIGTLSSWFDCFRQQQCPLLIN